MKNKICHTLLCIFTILPCFSQVVEFGISFSPYGVVETTTTVVSVESTDYLKKILEYFSKQTTCDDNTSLATDVSTKTIDFSVIRDNEEFVIIEGTSTISYEKIKNLFYSFGRREIIRLLLIRQNSKTDVTLKTIVQLRNEGKTLKEIALKCGVDYLKEVWIPSEKIFNHIFLNEEK